MKNFVLNEVSKSYKHHLDVNKEKRQEREEYSSQIDSVLFDELHNRYSKLYTHLWDQSREEYYAIRRGLKIPSEPKRYIRFCQYCDRMAHLPVRGFYIQCDSRISDLMNDVCDVTAPGVNIKNAWKWKLDQALKYGKDELGSSPEVKAFLAERRKKHLIKLAWKVIPIAVIALVLILLIVLMQ